jgi:hypothetical protein
MNLYFHYEMQCRSISHSYGFIGTTCLLDSRVEALMATITFDTADQNEQVRKQIKAALAAYREMLDTFVRNQMRQAAEEAEHACPRPSAASPSKPSQ